MMDETKQSDSSIVVMKRANKEGKPSADPVERRDEAKGNSGCQRTRRTQERSRCSRDFHYGLLCGPREWSLAARLSISAARAVDAGVAPPVTASALQLETAPKDGQESLAVGDDPPPVAGTTVHRHDPRQEPCGLTGTHGSVRGAEGNRRSYRDLVGALFGYRINRRAGEGDHKGRSYVENSAEI